MAQQVIKMQFVKSTKGTHVYGGSTTEAHIPSVYIKRAALPTNPPASIEITIGYED